MYYCLTGFGWLTDHAAAIQAVAAIASVILAGVLALITRHYASITNKILKESEKSRRAAELQASSSQAQATAAFESIALVRQQMEDQLGLGRSVIHTVIDSAISAIARWKSLPLTHVAKAPGFPPSDDLIPANATNAVEHARRISHEMASQLSSAFDELKSARSEIERIRLLGNSRGVGSSFLDTRPSKAPEYLDSAFRKFQDVKAAVPLA
jgi:hypothetical protein